MQQNNSSQTKEVKEKGKPSTFPFLFTLKFKTKMHITYYLFIIV